MTDIHISIDDALRLAERLLAQVGFSAADARTAASHLVTAEARGYPGHGLRRLLGICRAQKWTGHPETIECVIDKPGFVLYDGRNRLGICAVEDALKDAEKRLASSASIIFAVRGYRGTTGSLGIYGTEAARRGVISILMCNSEFAVAPHGSARAVLGTNPVAISLPGDPTSFSADIATSAWSYGSIRDAIVAGRQIPVGVVQTEAGGPSSDPNDADNGSQLPMAGHKGYGLGLAIELLCGAVIGAKSGRDAVKGSDGFVGILLRGDAARPWAEANSDAQALFAEIRRGPLAKNSSGIRIPGERAASGAAGSQITVPTALLDELKALEVAS